MTRARYDKNKALYKRMYDLDFGKDMSVFDVIIDTDSLTAPQVIEAARERVRGML